MSLKMILCGAMALPLFFVGSALASGGGVSGHESGGITAPAPYPSYLRPLSPQQAPVVVAQQLPAVNNLEEQLRELNGKVEELNFQVLQMQDQIRKMQQDNEFRFQQLEGKEPGAQENTQPPEKKSSLEPPAQAPAAPAAQAAPEATASAGGDGRVLGAPPTTFGTITFDANGNVVGGSANPGIGTNGSSGNASAQGSAAGADQGSVVAALPPADSPDELYRNSYQFILSGEYKTAEAGFRKHIDEFPNDPRAADAHFWLGESLLGQDRYRDAAEVFLKANRKYPESKKAPDMLLKLGIALTAMNQRDVACATYGEIGQRYPDVSAALQERIKQEQALAGC
jgi:tol-pal system protein YbgF